MPPKIFETGKTEKLYHENFNPQIPVPTRINHSKIPLTNGFDKRNFDIKESCFKIYNPFLSNTFVLFIRFAHEIAHFVRQVYWSHYLSRPGCHEPSYHTRFFSMRSISFKLLHPKPNSVARVNQGVDCKMTTGVSLPSAAYASSAMCAPIVSTATGS